MQRSKAGNQKFSKHSCCCRCPQAATVRQGNDGLLLLPPAFRWALLKLDARLSPTLCPVGERSLGSSERPRSAMVQKHKAEYTTFLLEAFKGWNPNKSLGRQLPPPTKFPHNTKHKTASVRLRSKPFALSKLHSFRFFEPKSDLLGTHCSGTARSLQAKLALKLKVFFALGKLSRRNIPTVSLKTYNHCFTDQLKTKQTQRRTGLVLGTAQTDSKREPHEFQLIPPD